MRGTATARSATALGVLAASALVIVVSTPAGAEARGGAATVLITMTDSNLESAPMAASQRNVVFKIVNHGSAARDFEIAGRRTAQIASGKSATLKVAFASTGTFLYLSYGPGRTRGLSNALRVLEACAHPATSTIRVQMMEGPITLSRASVPCGTVIFLVKNAGKIVHSFRIDNPDSPAGVIPPGGHGPRISPGHSVKMEVQFDVTGRAFYYCGEAGHNEDYSELGWLSVV